MISKPKDLWQSCKCMDMSSKTVIYNFNATKRKKISETSFKI